MSKTLTHAERLERIEKELGLTSKIGTTHVGVVLDRSGSMGPRREATITGFNEYLNEIRGNEDADKMRLTLSQFDYEYNTLHEGAKLDAVEELTTETYVPRGSTALYDAIGRTVHKVKGDMKKNDRALIVIMTDGMENSSQEYDKKAITKLIEDCQGEGNWTFVYLGAGIDAFADGTGIGITGGNTFSYSSSPAATRGTFKSLGHTHSLYMGQSAGSVANFAATMDETGTAPGDHTHSLDPSDPGHGQ